MRDRLGLISVIAPLRSPMPMPMAASVNIARNRCSLTTSRDSASRRASSTARPIASCSTIVASRSAAV